MALTLDEKRDEIRKVVAAVTATLDDESAAQVEALGLLGTHDSRDLAELIEQYTLIVGALLQMTSGMTALAGKLQHTYTPEELLQKLALGFEERWSS